MYNYISDYISSYCIAGKASGLQTYGLCRISIRYTSTRISSLLLTYESLRFTAMDEEEYYHE